MSQPAYAYATTKDTGNPARQLTLYVIAEHINVETGKTYCGVRTLMRETKVRSDRTMRNYLARLEQDGFIRREKRTRENGANTTDNVELVGFLEWYARGMGVAGPSAKITGGSAKFTGGRGNQRTGAPGKQATGHNNTSFNSNSNSARAKKSDYDFESEVAEVSASNEFIIRKVDPGWAPWEDYTEKRDKAVAREMRASFAALVTSPRPKFDSPLPRPIRGHPRRAEDSVPYGGSGRQPALQERI